MAIFYDKDEQGIVTLTIDMPNRSVNVLNQAFYAAFEAVLDKLEADEQVTGVILTSAKKTFVVGADIDESFVSDDAADYFEMSQRVQRLFRRLELLGKPVVAALNGSALGGGLELALACHYRVGVENGRIQYSFPEVSLGVLPGAGGVTRTVRLIGLQKGLEWLTQNKKYTPTQALAAGMIHELAADFDDMIARAHAWIGANPAPKAPWDAVKRYKIPGGGPSHPAIAQMLAVAPAMMRLETRGNYPAPPAILAAAVEGSQVDFETACRIESRYFAQLAAGQVSRNMISTFWTQLNQIKKGENHPQQLPQQVTEKIGVLDLHFFPPGSHSKVVEIVVNEQTDDVTLAKAFNDVLALKKVPIVVQDSPGFYVTRVSSTGTNEAMVLLAEGQHPHAIEMAWLQAGMPMGNGLYLYENGRKHLCPDLASNFMSSQPQLNQQEMMDRILFIQSIETVRCLEEGVLHSVADANLGSVLGWGFAPFHGGTLQFINAYGIENFVARAKELAAQYGERFQPPQLLFDKIKYGTPLQ